MQKGNAPSHRALFLWHTSSCPGDMSW